MRLTKLYMQICYEKFLTERIHRNIQGRKCAHCFHNYFFLYNLLLCTEILPRILGNTEVDYRFKDGALIEFLIEMTHISNAPTWIGP